MAKDKDAQVLASVSGRWVSYTHTAFAYGAFFAALAVGMSLHFHKIVKNQYYGYPDEWFPSVSATIGDRYPERSIFQLLIAITSGPRFALVFLWYLLTARAGRAAAAVAAVGLARTVMCGGWVYITSTDDHDAHDVFMILYLILTLPWTVGCLLLSPVNARAVRWRKRLAAAFFATLVPLVYYFIQHKVHRVAGAYTKYAFFEWSLILFDVGFDAVTAWDFDGFELRVVETGKTASSGYVSPRLPLHEQPVLGDRVLEKARKENVMLPQALMSANFSWNDCLDVLADIYCGFMFWSTLTSLGLTVWYFPLWHMGISGYETLILTTVSPFFLGIPAVRKSIIANPRTVYSLSLFGIGAFMFAMPELRLAAVGFGVLFSCLAWAGSFWAERNNAGRLDAKISAFSLGLIMSVVAKFANHTNNPVWPIMNSINGGLNKTGLLLGILAVLRSTRRTPLGNQYISTKDARPESSVLPALGLGGLLFALHSMLSDSSTMITWVWSGYPINGPLPAPHGAFIIAAMGAGFLLGLFRPHIAQTWTAFIISGVSAAILYANDGWTGFYGALVLALYLPSLLPPFISAATRAAPGRTFGSAFMVYNLLVLAHVWVVAYAFVPGGPLLRERTDIVLKLTWALIGCGVFSLASKPPSRGASPAPSKSPSRTYSLYTLLLLQLISIATAYLRFPTYNYTPYHPEDRLLTAGIWTVHFALDNDMWSSERRMRDAIRDLELDVVGLLETDLQRIIMGNRDMSQFLAEDLGMYADYGPGPNKHTWGAILLSKFPIVNSTHHLLPSPVGELAPAIHATLDVYGELIDVLVFHSGQEEDVEDRRLQSLGIQDIMASSPRPLILLSYLVTDPKKGNYNTYVSEKSRMKDIDESDWDRWCEYILYRGVRRVGYARVSRGTITDTEIQVGKFVVGKEEAGLRDGRFREEFGVPETAKRVKEEEVPVGWRFPAMFRGKGVRGHRYHVFKEPRYWL